VDELLRQLAAFGPGGVIAAIAIYTAWHKDKQLQAANTAMLSMQERMLERYYAAINETNATVRALIDGEERP
jgi:Tfp pilus assembly protein PilE